jgi:hypothetical protein
VRIQSKRASKQTVTEQWKEWRGEAIFASSSCASESLGRRRSAAHTRLFETLIRDEYVVSGTSIKGETHPEHREHVVPGKVIRDYCLNLFDQGASDREVAVFIRDHLKIIKITKEEARLSQQKMERHDACGLDGWWRCNSAFFGS